MDGYAELQRQVRAAPRGTGTLSAVHDLVRAYAAFAVANPQLYRLMMGTGITARAQYAELTEAHDRTCAILIDAVALAQEAGEVEPGDPVTVAVTLWCLVHGLSTLAVDGRIDAGAVDAEIGRSLEILEHGLRPRPSHAERGRP
ncbi:TetR-like C-terminal domain-containing protein [Nonomuraea sp. NPDC003754]